MTPPTRSRLLIVDDEDAILETMTYTFEDDYEVLTATDPRRALELLDEYPPIAAVITDQRMPGMTGVEFLTRVYEKHPTTSRIILTGFADMEAILRAINDGHVYAYISKPWEPDELKQVVRRAVDHHALQVENARLLAGLRHSNALLEAVIDRLGMGALAVDDAGVIQAANGPARAQLGIETDPRGRRLAELLSRPGMAPLESAIASLGSGESPFQEAVLQVAGHRMRLRVSTERLMDCDGKAFGRVLLLREISHEPLRRRFEEVVADLVAEPGALRPGLERAVTELRELGERVKASGISSPGMGELAERGSRTVTALENWLAIDDALADEAFPDAQLLVDRMRVAMSRWPLPDEVPARVRELAKRVEAYYESGDNPKQRIL
ncbi:MAG: response regulator [Deltaproteobacteria bacterium]|nr:response regulator [Deltaproteobacteria bacterium]